jgi:hypothetical protein
MRIKNRPRRAGQQLNRRDCEVDAELAAEMAGDAAALAVHWAQSAGVAEDDAVEAVRAAERARLAAERALHAADDDVARLETAGAWAAAESALEADQRVVEAIAESFDGLH